MTNNEVAQSWADNKSGRTSKADGTYRFSTDGSNLYSYNLLIGFTSVKGEKVALQYQACAKYNRNDDGWFRSRTTSCHVSLAMRKADIVAIPDEIEQYERVR